MASAMSRTSRQRDVQARHSSLRDVLSNNIGFYFFDPVDALDVVSGNIIAPPSKNSSHGRLHPGSAIHLSTTLHSDVFRVP
jgi:hypothetical protein